jgi:hypothetical protein
MPLLDNIQSQGFYDMSEAMHTSGLQLLDSLPHADKLRGELGAVSGSPQGESEGHSDRSC